MKGDFEKYKEKLVEAYSKEIKELEKIIENPKDNYEENESVARLNEIKNLMELDSNQKVQELEKVKLIIDSRLINQNLTEPQVRIQKEMDAVEVSLPGISNSNEILDIIRNTDVVEYRLDEDRSSGFLFSNLIDQMETELIRQGKREETDIHKFQMIINKNLGREKQDEFLREIEKKYNIPDKYKVFSLLV